jgi:hypothetical protein
LRPQPPDGPRPQHAGSPAGSAALSLLQLLRLVGKVCKLQVEAPHASRECLTPARVCIQHSATCVNDLVLS